MVKKKNVMNIFNACNTLVDIVTNTKVVDKNVLVKIDKVVDMIDKDFIKNRCVDEVLKNMLKRFKDGDLKQACYHANIFKKKTKIHANDLPFEKGDVVAVKRTEHGWVDGGITAKIKECIQNENGVWSYKAIVCSKGNVGSGSQIEIKHTRDACLY